VNARELPPRGLCVAVLGVDGAGKSTLLRSLAERPPAWCAGVVIRHLGPWSRVRRREPATDPHLRPPRGLVMSVVKSLYWLAEYTLGYWFGVRPELARGRLVLFDRYLLDAIVDARRYRYGGPSWLLRLAWRSVPKPGVIVLLDAPWEVLAARKQEIGPAEMARQRQAYLDLVRNERGGRIVDADRTVDEIVRAFEALIAPEPVGGKLDGRLARGR